ncbi:cytochrome P450 [Paractinoplanes brasiliensis]|uniref:Cytochrome P450 n=1 Tax=Paractinoplanes brasiliensis TaxID=52695 RepID=A0A4R6JPR6_9ACTN|nr:cytochrome P450 [Actinoplanes brasiliensis]TDO36595.1 cytochrome P450 [Actinoplanes brasiliensis]GID32437.1 cytochrome P450 [Actinoplanes brasiliensis]
MGGYQDVQRLAPMAVLGAFRRDPLELFADVARAPAGIAETSAFGRRMVFITHPDHVVHVLRDNHRNYTKDAPVYRVARPFLGDGLTVSPGGEEWLRRRRLVQPAFGRSTVEDAARVTEECLAEVAGRWATTDTVDASAEMSALSMRFACRILFGTELTAEAAALVEDLRLICDHVANFLARPFPPLAVPTPANLRFRAAMRRVRATVAELVADPRTELISRLTADGGSTREQVTDEVLGLFFAGHETLGHTLAWCWQLLAGHPAAAARLHAELDDVLGDRRPASADLPRLVYTRQVVDEAMRLYPVVWIMMRRAVGDDTIGGHRIGAGSLVTWSPYAGNRHPDVWQRPDDFWPERFADEAGRGAAYHRNSVVPFGLGPRACPGSNLATIQACLTVATLARHVRGTPPPGAAVAPVPSITLRPAGPVPLHLAGG